MSFWTKFLGGAVAPVAEKVVVYFTRKGELAQARFEAQLKFEQAMGDRRAELIKAGLTADMNWEMEFAQQARTSWKDEYTLAVVSLPLVMAFVGFAAQVDAGFKAFAGTPVWYQVMVQAMFYATVGIRFWRRSQSDT
jgi:hypothetical protein